jgi:flagellar FliL protein
MKYLCPIFEIMQPAHLVKAVLALWSLRRPDPLSVQCTKLRARLLLLAVVSSLLTPGALAQEEAAEDVEDPDAEQTTDVSKGTSYLKLSNDMVVNYGDPSLGRLRYLKFAVNVRVESSAIGSIVGYHQPALLDALILLFSSQSDARVNSAAGKEEIRQLALQEVRRIMKREEGEEYIQDLLFVRFVVQR